LRIFFISERHGGCNPLLIRNILKSQIKKCRPEKGKPPKRVGRKVTGLNLSEIGRQGCRADTAPEEPYLQGTLGHGGAVMEPKNKKSNWLLFLSGISGLRFFLIIALVLCLSFNIISIAFAAQVRLAWDSNSETDLAGYKIYYGTASGSYGTSVNIGRVTNYAITGLAAGQRYYVSLKAYDSSGNESGFSNEVVGVARAGRGDFNDDGKTDLIWLDQTTGGVYVWFMDGTNFVRGSWVVASAGANERLVGTGDFNGDGKPDIVWQNTSNGQNVVWYMDGATVTGIAVLPSISSPWTIVGIGDFNGDGKPDILWRDTSRGQNAVWYMDGTSITGVAVLHSVSNQNWAIVGVGDFNGDGKPDILWRNTSNGQNAVWYVNGTNAPGIAVLNGVNDQNWTIVGVGDFNGDGKADILWRNASNGLNVVWYMDGVNHLGAVSLPSVNNQAWTIVGR
jgi:hypothetical protein